MCKVVCYLQGLKDNGIQVVDYLQCLKDSSVQCCILLSGPQRQQSARLLPTLRVSETVVSKIVYYLKGHKKQYCAKLQTTFRVSKTEMCKAAHYLNSFKDSSAQGFLIDSSSYLAVIITSVVELRIVYHYATFTTITVLLTKSLLNISECQHDN